MSAVWQRKKQDVNLLPFVVAQEPALIEQFPVAADRL